MYREDGWEKGFYIDNHRKYECYNCGKQFIVGEELMKGSERGYPLCPYCGQHNVDCVVWTEDEELQKLDSDMGCLAIFYVASEGEE